MTSGNNACTTCSNTRAIPFPYLTSKKTGGPISADEDVKARLFKEDIEGVRNRLFMAGRVDFENVDRGAWEKAGQLRRGRGIMAGGLCAWCGVGKGPQRKGAAGTKLVPSLDISYQSMTTMCQIVHQVARVEVIRAGQRLTWERGSVGVRSRRRDGTGDDKCRFGKEIQAPVQG